MQDTPVTNADQIGERPVWGAKAIGAVIGKTERQAYYLLEKGLLPAKKVGDQHCALPSKLIAACGGDVKVEAAA